ncbi:hypothetical protein [Streptomyces globosus]|uniref:hypothetical protein n=1 Tax=Streptomyces globosus TaxID=68209 RepID=UPI00381EE1AE
MKRIEVADRMTGEVVSGTPDTPVGDVAEPLARCAAARVPVPADGGFRRRVGEVLPDAAEALNRDAEVRVADGLVTLDGTAARRGRLRLRLGPVERLDGVAAVASYATALSDGTVGAPAGRTRQVLPW